MDMTISQALRKISKLKGALKEQLERASSSVTYEEDRVPAFSFASSMEQADLLRNELVRLETALRITNAHTKISNDGKTITLAEATCILQERKGHIAFLKGLGCMAQPQRVDETSEWDETSSKRFTKKKVIKCDLPEAKRADLVRQEQDLFDALNDAVETVNHRTSLVG